MQRRQFRDDVELSIIGLGGLTLVGMEPKAAHRLVAEAIDRGVNYFDVAPAYGGGEAETKLGAALAPYRKNVFLACKTLQREAVGARKDLEESLRRLGTDYFDLYQFHALSQPSEIDEILGPGGAAEDFVRAREEGKVRHIGLTAHSVPAALAMLDRFQLDSVMFPVNFVCYSQGDLGPQVLERARELSTARIAIKALARTRHRPDQARFRNCWYWPVEERSLARQALRFTLSEDVTAAIPPADESLFRWCVESAEEFVPLTSEERRELLQRARGFTPIMSNR